MTECRYNLNGCVQGIAIDIDEYTDGWQRDVIYPPCECNPKYCANCQGLGFLDGGDCEKCEGSGWLGTPDKLV